MTKSPAHPVILSRLYRTATAQAPGLDYWAVWHVQDGNKGLIRS